MKNTKTLNIFFLGAPASGKGTQASLLAQKFNLYQIDMGDLLRRWAKKKDRIGKCLNKIIKKGELAPSALVIFLWVKELLKIKSWQGLIAEGNPRTLEEANLIFNLLKFLDRHNFKVIYLKVSSAEVKRRILSRVICSRCGSEFSLRLEPKLVNCSHCGGKLIKRDDDNLKSLAIRMKQWQLLRPVINYCRRQKILIEVNGEGPINSIHKNILKKLA